MGSLSHSAENFGLSTRSSAPSLSEKKGRQGREPAGLLNFGKGFHMSLAGMCENCEKHFPSSSLPEKEKQLITISQRYFPSQAIKILGLGLRLNCGAEKPCRGRAWERYRVRVRRACCVSRGEEGGWPSVHAAKADKCSHTRGSATAVLWPGVVFYSIVSIFSSKGGLQPALQLLICLIHSKCPQGCHISYRLLTFYILIKLTL